eukprot:jgi/Orpsp1_1/1187155/evm.model.d7180000055803.1
MTVNKTDFYLIFIITIIIPPLGILITDGINIQLLINLILTILCYIPGLIHGLYIVYKRLSDENYTIYAYINDNKNKYNNINIKNSTVNNNISKNNIEENNIEENNKNENDIEKSNVNINIEITENEKKKKKRLVIFIKPKKYKRVRKSVEKEKLKLLINQKLIIFGVVYYSECGYWMFPTFHCWYNKYYKNGKDDEIFDNINNQKDKDKLIEITTDLFNTDYYTMENPTETDTVSILTSFPTPSSSPSPSPSEVSFNDLEYSKTITEITPTPSIMSTSTQYINNKLIAFDDNTNKNNTIRYFNGDDLFYDITDDDNIIKYNINNDFVKRADDINDNTNDNAKDNNNEKEEKNEKDEKDKEKTKELILNIVVK